MIGTGMIEGIFKKSFPLPYDITHPCHKNKRGREETIAVLTTPRTSVKPMNRLDEVAKIFLDHKDLYSLPVVHHDIPVGIVHRHELMNVFLSPYGRDLHGRKPITHFMDTNPLIVEYDVPIQVASQYITQNVRIPAAQDFIVTRDGEYEGMGTVLDLLEKVTALKIEHLRAENSRLSAEVQVAHRLQQMLLPREQELKSIENLEIASFMQPADEVGGDYYDVLTHEGHVKIGIGDITGHGLESGVVMLMVQTAVRTLLTHNEVDEIKFLNTLNRVIYQNVERMNSDKSLSLMLIDYQNRILQVSGQHEKIILVRTGGDIELIDTKNLGFPVGLIGTSISDFIAKKRIHLLPGNIVILYTDGITEAQNSDREQYGLKRLCQIASIHWQDSAETVKNAIIADVHKHLAGQKIFDDMTLLILKQR